MDTARHSHKLTPSSARRLVLLVGLGGVMLGACSVHSSSPTTSGPNSIVPTTSIPPSSTSSSVATAPTCSTAILEITSKFLGAEAGSSSYAFTATNNGPDACSLDGYPTLTFFSASGAGGSGAGQQLPIKSQATGAAPTLVNLDPKGTAQFQLRFADVPVNGAGCSAVTSINVTPPGSNESIPVSESFQPCGPTVNVTAFGPPGSADV